MAEGDWQPPAIPEETVQEGGRWRYHRPTSEQVAEWFRTQPLDDGMDHEHYVGGVVIIPQSEKVKYQRPQGGTFERHEMTYTPYVQIGTRIAYFRRLAELRGFVPRIVPAEVPRSTVPGSPFFNANLPEGFWYHVAHTEQGQTVRYLCCTMHASMYEPTVYGRLVAGKEAMPVLQGVGTKQGNAGADPNSLMKCQTSAIGRALAAAGILVIGTGVASAEDMQEPTAFGAPTPELQLPGNEAAAPRELTDVQLRQRIAVLQAQMQEEQPEKWTQVSAWYRERAAQSGWNSINDVPRDGLQAIVKRMEEA